MKIRNGFVTNSSSSSFIIAKKNLSNEQIRAIKLHERLGIKLGILYSNTDSWTIEDNEDFITGYTYMDNFSMYEFFQKIQVNMDLVIWDAFPFNLNEFDDSRSNKIDENSDWLKELHKLEEGEDYE